jgi:hypothetical protein
MEEENTQGPNGQDPDATDEGSPVPEHEDGGDSRDIRGAD